MYHDLSSCLCPLPCLDCPAPSPKPTICEGTLQMGEESCPAAKNAHFSYQKTPPHQYKLYFIFLTSGFMYRHIMLTLISRGLLNLICMMAKALNDQNSSKQNFQTTSPPFNAIWKTFLQLLLVLTLINLLIAC